MSFERVYTRLHLLDGNGGWARGTKMIDDDKLGHGHAHTHRERALKTTTIDVVSAILSIPSNKSQ